MLIFCHHLVIGGQPGHDGLFVGARNFIEDVVGSLEVANAPSGEVFDDVLDLALYFCFGDVEIGI